jgi:hypothetical protein
MKVTAWEFEIYSNIIRIRMLLWGIIILTVFFKVDGRKACANVIEDTTCILWMPVSTPFDIFFSQVNA